MAKRYLLVRLNYLVSSWHLKQTLKSLCHYGLDLFHSLQKWYCQVLLCLHTSFSLNARIDTVLQGSSERLFYEEQLLTFYAGNVFVGCKLLFPMCIKQIHIFWIAKQ